MTSLQEEMLAQVTDEHGFLKTEDGVRLFYRYWTPAKKPKCAVLFLHGMSLHSGAAPYGPNIGVPHLVDFGAAVYAFDMRGHGLSEGVPGDYPRVEAVMDDIRAQVNLVRSRIRKRMPVFVYGHNMGGLQALTYAAGYGSTINGAIVSGYAPAVRMEYFKAGKPGFAEQLRMAFVPLFKRGAPVSRVLTLGQYRNAGGKDPEVERMLKVIEDDPLAVKAYSIRFYFGSGVRKEFKNVPLIKKPFLMILGDRDQQFEPGPARRLLEDVTSNIKSLRVLEDVDHFGVVEKGQTTIVGWLDRLEKAGLMR